jgi:hypothetical protein
MHTDSPVLTPADKNQIHHGKAQSRADENQVGKYACRNAAAAAGSAMASQAENAGQDCSGHIKAENQSPSMWSEICDQQDDFADKECTCEAAENPSARRIGPKQLNVGISVIEQGSPANLCHCLPLILSEATQPAFLRDERPALERRGGGAATHRPSRFDFSVFRRKSSNIALRS